MQLTLKLQAQLCGRAAVKCDNAALQRLVQRLCTMQPEAAFALTDSFAAALQGDSESQAMLAVDVLMLLLPNAVQHKRREAAQILVRLRAAAHADAMPELRLKITNLLPGIIDISSSCGSGGREDGLCRKALARRLHDAEASVRAAAVRSTGQVALANVTSGASVHHLAIGKLTERLRDVSEAVRTAVRTHNCCPCACLLSVVMLPLFTVIASQCKCPVFC